MGEPVKFKLSCQEWHIFLISGLAFRDLKGHMIGHILPTDLQTWLIDQMRDEWSVGKSSTSRTIHVYIKSKSDAMLFKLTWFNRIEKAIFRG